MTNIEMREVHNKIWKIISEMEELNVELSKNLHDKTKVEIASCLIRSAHALTQAIDCIYQSGYTP